LIDTASLVAIREANLKPSQFERERHASGILTAV
jgi:hypothetical protein